MFSLRQRNEGRQEKENEKKNAKAKHIKNTSRWWQHRQRWATFSHRNRKLDSRLFSIAACSPSRSAPDRVLLYYIIFRCDYIGATTKLYIRAARMRHGATWYFCTLYTRILERMCSTNFYLFLAQNGWTNISVEKATSKSSCRRHTVSYEEAENSLQQSNRRPEQTPLQRFRRAPYVKPKWRTSRKVSENPQCRQWQSSRWEGWGIAGEIQGQ